MTRGRSGPFALIGAGFTALTRFDLAAVDRPHRVHAPSKRHLLQHLMAHHAAICASTRIQGASPRPRRSSDRVPHSCLAHLPSPAVGGSIHAERAGGAPDRSAFQNPHHVAQGARF
jgi:hypothetical protein